MAKSLERPAPRGREEPAAQAAAPVLVLGRLRGTWRCWSTAGCPGWEIVYWIVPFGDPPGNAWGEQAWEILWYLRTYLWFVLLSPLLLRIFRLAPVPVLVLSLAPVLVLNFLRDAPQDNRFGSALWDLATYLCCWLLGLRTATGVLRRLRPAAVGAASLAALAYGGWFALAHRAEYGTYDLDEIPLAQAFWSAGFVILLLYVKAATAGSTSPGWRASGGLDRMVTIFNRRAVRIYLWHEIALILAVPLMDEFCNFPAFETWLPPESQWFLFGVGWACVGTRPALRLGRGRGGEEEAAAAALGGRCRAPPGVRAGLCRVIRSVLPRWERDPRIPGQAAARSRLDVRRRGGNGRPDERRPVARPGRVWRKEVAKAVDARPAQKVLDLAAGTATSSLPFARSGAYVVPCDFSLGDAPGGQDNHPWLPLTAGDATKLPFKDDAFDTVTISFGLRNVQDTDAPSASCTG